MPVVVAWIGEMLLTVVGRMAISALISVGVGFALHAVGHSVGEEPEIQAMLAQAGPLAAYVGWFGLDQAITIILSAWAGREATEALKSYVTENFHPKLKAGGGE